MDKLLQPFFIIIAVVAADQATKIWAVSFLSENSPVELIGHFFMLTLVFNEGGAMGTNLGSATYYLIFSLIILAFIFYYMWANRGDRTITFPLAFIAGGAVGNIIDRIYYGKVVDFIDIDFFNINLFGYHLERWWTFNIADTVISCSIIFLLIRIIFFMPRIKPEQSDIARS